MFVRRSQLQVRTLSTFRWKANSPRRSHPSFSSVRKPLIKPCKNGEIQPQWDSNHFSGVPGSPVRYRSVLFCKAFSSLGSRFIPVFPDDSVRMSEKAGSAVRFPWLGSDATLRQLGRVWPRRKLKQLTLNLGPMQLSAIDHQVAAKAVAVAND